MSDFVWPHALQQARLPYSPLSPVVCSDSWSLSWYITLFCLCLQSFPASGSFPMSQVNKCRGFQSNKGSVLGSQWQCLELGPVLYNGLVQNTAVQWIVSSWGGLRTPHHPLRVKDLASTATNGKSVSHLYPSLEVRVYRADPSSSPRVQQLGGKQPAAFTNRLSQAAQRCFSYILLDLHSFWFPQNKDDLES